MGANICTNSQSRRHIIERNKTRFFHMMSQLFLIILVLVYNYLEKNLWSQIMVFFIIKMSVMHFNFSKMGMEHALIATRIFVSFSKILSRKLRIQKVQKLATIFRWCFLYFSFKILYCEFFLIGWKRIF